MCVIARVHNIKREESVLLWYSQYKRVVRSDDAILVTTIQVLIDHVTEVTKMLSHQRSSKAL